MHSDNDKQGPSPQELADQARAHALEASLTTMEKFLTQEDKYFLLAEETVTRIGTDGKVASEPTRLILLVDSKRPLPLTPVYYEGADSGERGYGVLDSEAEPSSVKMESFTSPQHLLQVYGDEVVLAIARVIRNRNDEIRINQAFNGEL